MNLQCVQDSVHRNICVRLNGRYPRMGVDISAGNSASDEIQERLWQAIINAIGSHTRY